MYKTILLDKPGVFDLSLPLNKEGQEVEVWGMIKAEEEGDYQVRVVVDHKVGQTNGRVKIKGIAKNGARVKIEGLIKIDKMANGVDDFLEMRMLLLDEKSQATAEPMLEIEANEVKASHAAAVSKIDDEQLFYLMSRGMEKEGAEKLIVDGFLGEVENKINQLSKKDD